MKFLLKILVLVVLMLISKLTREDKVTTSTMNKADDTESSLTSTLGQGEPFNQVKLAEDEKAKAIYH
ncbi:MAG: hypothetical protein LPK14_13200 [Hymenobacteraceae bacterium]|nr:hypothetical protein [Hymenobacteraceae bacterium]